MRHLKTNFLILILTLVGTINASAQSVLASPTTKSRGSVTTIKPEPIESPSYKDTSDRIAEIDQKLESFKAMSGASTSGATVVAIPGVCPPLGGSPCVPVGASMMAAQSLLQPVFKANVASLKATFKSNVMSMENEIKNKIGQQDSNLKIADCSLENSSAIDTVIKAIECQRLRIEVSFAELSKKEGSMLNKQTNILREFEVDKLNAEARLEIGEDKLNNACVSASTRVAGVEAAENTSENYRVISNTLTNRNTLDAESLQEASAVSGETYTSTIDGAANERLASSLAFMLPGDFEISKEGKTKEQIEEEKELIYNTLKPTSFDIEGNIVGVPVEEISFFYTPPEGYKFDEIYPGADRNYSGMVLDRPVIRDNEHLFAAVNSIVNLINPIPEEVDLSQISTNAKGSTEFAKKKSRQARYSIAQDITNFSTAFRSVPIVADEESEQGSGSNFIKSALKKLGAQPKEYQDIGEEVSEYQFLDAMARRMQQASGYYATVFVDDTTAIDREIIRSMATTLAVKWKQYQILEKILAARATELAVNVEELQN